MNKKNVILCAVGGAIILALGFAGGLGVSKLSKNNRNFGQGQLFDGSKMGMMGNLKNSGRGLGSGFNNGEVLSIDDKSIIIKLPSGGSKSILYSDSTKVYKSVEGALTDINTGDRIMVIGKNNTDGSVSAESIQIQQVQPVEIAPTEKEEIKK